MVVCFPGYGSCLWCTEPFTAASILQQPSMLIGFWYWCFFLFDHRAQHVFNYSLWQRPQISNEDYKLNTP